MNQPQLLSSSNTFPSMSASRLHIPSKKTQTNLSAILQTSQANPTATSSKIRYPSPSRGSRTDERPYKRVSMEEELNGHRPQSISVQEREIGSTRNTDFEEEKEAKLENKWATLNTSLQAPQSNNLTVNAKLLSSLEEAKMGDIEKKFFVQDHCLLCGKNVSRNFKAHVRIHIEGRKHIKSYYSFCLDEDDKTLQIKCDKCPRIFNQLTVEKLREHSQACNAIDISSNNKLGSIINNGADRLEKLEEKCEEEFKALQDQITSIKARLDKNDAKVNEVSKTQETMKEKLDNTDNKMTTFEQKIKAVEEKVENHENVLMGLLNFLVKQDNYKEVASVSTRLIKSDQTKNESKEKERERERSRERARNGSQERRTARQVSERPEERKIRRRENSSEERSQDKRQTARYDNKGRQSYQYKGSDRRY